jgi:hypothetical protein
VRSHLARGAAAGLLLAPTLSLAAAAGTASAALSLRWSDPNGLAATTANEFEARLSERLGHAAFNPAVTERALSVSWQGAPDQCRIELSLVESGNVEGTREIESPNGDCPALVPALLTVAALLVEAQQPEPAPIVTPAAPPPPSSPPPSGPPPAQASTGEQALVLISLGGALTAGLAPKLELGPAAALVWAPLPQLRLGAEGALFLEREYGKSPGFSLNHRRAGLLACAMPLHGRLALGICANAAFQFFGSEGMSLPHPQSRHATTLSVGGGIRAEWRLAPHWWWVGHVGADVATRRLYFYYIPPQGTETTLFRQERVTPGLLLGLTLELP